jgi:hypothetical protein
MIPKIGTPEDPVFGTWYYLSFLNFLLKVVPSTRCSQKIFQIFSRSKNKVLDRYKYPKKTFFEFFSSISWGLCTGTKGEKLKFYSSNILNSSIGPGLNPKSITFSPLVPVQSPQEIEIKI